MAPYICMNQMSQAGIEPGSFVWDSKATTPRIPTIHIAYYNIFRTVILNLPGIFIMELMACLIGLIVCAYYASVQCDPLKSGMISNLNQVKFAFSVQVIRDNCG